MDPLSKWWTGRSKSISKTNSLSFTSFSDVFLYQVRICLYNWGTDMFSTEWFYDATWTLCEAKNHEFPAMILLDATFWIFCSIVLSTIVTMVQVFATMERVDHIFYTNVYVQCNMCHMLAFLYHFCCFLCLIFGAAWVFFIRFVLSDFCIISLSEVAPLGDWLLWKDLES